MHNLASKGRVFQPSDPDFATRLENTLFNKRPLTRQPDLMVEPQDVEDIQTTIRYAKTVGKKISVCSGGHSWSANHVRNDSILIIMKQFNTYAVNKEAMTAIAGPGVGGSVLMKALVKQDLFFPAGHCEGVCIGGYLLQGGFGWNGRKLGMGCESVIGLDIVTAAGELVHASATENADLYWAARGSGAGFFGVVVAFHLKLYPRPKYMGAITHVFGMEHLDEVFRWAADVGPSVPSSIELQLLMTLKTVKFGKAGIEVLAPIFADTEEEWEAAKQFMGKSAIKKKAYIKIPYIPFSIGLMYKFAMTHYPAEHCWSVDNIWTNAAIDDLLPHLHHIAETMMPAPTHLLWLNWYPPKQRAEMAFSMENKIYLALYSAWQARNETARLETWATECISQMAHLSNGIQLADENLNHRTAKFVTDEHLQKLEEIRAVRDGAHLFNEWHSKPLLI
ncbi:MAG: FAD-binding oxidoreductase [Caldilineaceae bacterium]